MFHVREWTSGELLDVLDQYFEEVTLHTAKGVPIAQEEYRTTNHTPILAKCRKPKI